MVRNFFILIGIIYIYTNDCITTSGIRFIRIIECITERENPRSSINPPPIDWISVHSTIIERYARKTQWGLHISPIFFFLLFYNPRFFFLGYSVWKSRSIYDFRVCTPQLFAPHNIGENNLFCISSMRIFKKEFVKTLIITLKHAFIYIYAVSLINQSISRVHTTHIQFYMVQYR